MVGLNIHSIGFRKDAELKKFGKGKQKLQKQEKLREKKEEIEKVKAWSRKRKTNNSDKVGPKNLVLEGIVDLGLARNWKLLWAMRKRRRPRVNCQSLFAWVSLPAFFLCRFLLSILSGSQKRGNKKKEHKLQKVG